MRYQQAFALHKFKVDAGRLKSANGRPAMDKRSVNVLTPRTMKILSLLLPLAVALFFQAHASAQGLAGASYRLSGAINNLNGEVQSRLEKSEGRKDGINAVEQARIAVGDVYNQSSTRAPRPVVANSIVALRNSIGVLQQEMDKHRDRASIQNAMANVNAAMAQVNNAWANYGFGAVPPPPRFDDRVAGIAARAVADNLRIPLTNVSVVHIDRDGDRAHVITSVGGGRRYAVDMNGATGKIYAVNPVR